METTEIKKRHQDVSDLIAAERLCPALTRLLHEAGEAGFSDLSARINQRLVAYNLMLSTMSAGLDDPCRDQTFERLLDEAARINDIWADRLMSESESESLYYTRRRYLKSIVPADASCSTIDYLADQMNALMRQLRDSEAKSVSYSETVKVLEELMDDLFDAIWTDGPEGKAQDCVRILQLLTSIVSTPLTVAQRSLVVTAVSLSLLQWFSAAKIGVLVTVIKTCADVDVVERAWVGLCLALTRHSDRVRHNEEVKTGNNGLSSLYRWTSDRKDGYRGMCVVQRLLYQAQDADRARRCMVEKVSPELQRLVRQKAKPGPDGVGQVVELNLSQLRRSELYKSMTEVVNLQREGVDVMLNVFSNLCHHPFFNRRTNWFRPFDLENFDVLQRSAGRPEVYRLAQSMGDGQSRLSATDKFAYFMSFSSMEEGELGMLSRVMQEPPEADESNKSMEDGLEKARQEEVAMRNYVHDLYRFFTMNPTRHEFVNPFEGDLHLCTRPELAEWFDDRDRRKFADYLFTQQRYDEAFYLYDHMVEKDRMSMDLMQKYAYTAYVKSEPDLALTERLLIECNRNYPGDGWTLRFLAQYYMQRKNYAEALALLDEALMYRPGEYGLLVEMAQCLITKGRYDEALNYLYQAEETGKKDQDARRVIAWCLVLKGDMAQAEVYAQKMMQDGNRSVDWANAGLVALAAGDIATAVSRLSGSFKVARPWRAAECDRYFRRIEPDLQAHGFDARRLALVREAALVGQVYKS